MKTKDSKKFPKAARLLRNGQYQFVHKKGKRSVGSHIALSYLIQSNKPTRLGITVSKKYGKAHLRNRFKRVVREAFRHACAQFPLGLQVSVFPKKNPDDPSLSPKDLCEDFQALFYKEM